MKARLPQGYGKGSGNLAGMMKQAQKMQEDMTALQAELETTEYEATVGGGAVTRQLAKDMGADAYTENCIEAVEVAKTFVV